MSLADAIGLLRALSALPIAWAILAGERPLALGIYAVAAASDAIDGWVARRAGTATAHGALLDPLADKILVVGTLLVLSAAGTGWPVTLVALGVAARELVVAAARIRAFARGTALPAEGLAKLKTAGELIGTAMVIWGIRPWAVLGTGVVGLALLLGLYTLPRYLRPDRVLA